MAGTGIFNKALRSIDSASSRIINKASFDNINVANKHAAAKLMGGGAVVGGAYGAYSDNQTLMGGALKGALATGAIAGGYAGYRNLSKLGASVHKGALMKPAERNAARSLRRDTSLEQKRMAAMLGL